MNEFLQLAKLSKKGFNFVLAHVQKLKRFLECVVRTMLNGLKTCGG